MPILPFWSILPYGLAFSLSALHPPEDWEIEFNGYLSKDELHSAHVKLIIVLNEKTYFGSGYAPCVVQ